MRKTVAGPVKVHAGQRVSFEARLREERGFAFLQLYSFVKGYEPSPHVPAYKLGTVENGKPTMVSPVTLRLNPAKASGAISVVADENCYFQVVQEVDTPSDPTAKVRINRHVAERFKTLLSKVRRLLGGW